MIDMTTETTTELSPEAVLEEARRFFLDENSPFSATPVSESAGHLTLATFRSRMAISAFRDETRDATVVRLSTLRPDESVGKFMAHVRTGGAGSRTRVE